MTKREIQWAKQHDWFELAAESGVYVKDWTQEGKQISVFFSNYRKLRMWAGY